MLWRRWSGLPRTTRVVLLVYAALCAVLWLVPLLNRLHAESAAVVAAVAFFAAGLAALQAFRRGGALWRVLARQEAALLVPWAMLTVAALWAPNCAYGQGLLFFLLYAPVSVALAVGGAYALSATPWTRQGVLFVGIGLAVMGLGPLYDLGLHPQFYTYNHVFGGVLGPIYDEELVVRPGLLAFRGLTLLWALLLVLVGRRLREGGPGRTGAPALPPYLIPGAGLAIGLVYLFAAPLGINTPAWYVQRTLGGHLATEHFDLYYDPASVSEAALQRLAEDHEYRYAQLAERLGVAVPARIASYLYPDAETKGRLTGARTTNVAPVWLRRPQTHVLLDAYGRVFAHELAHVFSREFGMPILRASPAVGLVEGLAVALEPPDGLPTPHEQVAAALGQRMGLGRASLAEDVAARLSPLGFWTGRGAVSYTTLGSFVRYLLDAYGPARLRRLYATADFEAVYGRPVEALAAEWEAFLRALPVVDRAAGALVQRRFAVPSLFERRCPHHVPRPVRRYRAAAAALAEGDTTGAVAPLYAALAEAPAYEPALVLWARLRLAGGAPAEVIARLDTMAAVQRAPAL
ncbi:MAG: hypothetical protein R3247_10955, partial [Rhodothermales bacterium]|nr:hypothetical protein [Rhodothermales bacterium]